jgi:thiol-disulfide isomerase/thioredoxin
VSAFFFGRGQGRKKSNGWVGRRAPEFARATWVTSKPLTLAELKGKIVLVDFWEYSCINCVRTLPYLKKWYERYKQYGFVIIGIHAPEFEFGKNQANVEVAIKKFGITWPVVLDNEYKIWNSWKNSVWPRKFLIDQSGTVVHDHSGEGGYQDTEALIQQLIKKDHPEAQLPALGEFVREIDKPGKACYRTTPELYAGFERGILGNPEGYRQNQVIEYKDPGSNLPQDVLFVSGRWQNNQENMQRAQGEVGASSAWLGLTYHAKGVFAVIQPEKESGFRVRIEQDGKPLAKQDAGEDIQFVGDQSYLVIDHARMYRIVNNKEFGVHVLKLYPESDSFGLYAFTFETACQ